MEEQFPEGRSRRPYRRKSQNRGLVPVQRRVRRSACKRDLQALKPSFQPLAQDGQPDGADVEPVVEVSPEPPQADSAPRSTFVAATTLQSTGCSVLLPRRCRQRSCSTRSSLACKASGMDSISSRNSVPALACSMRLMRRLSAPGKRLRPAQAGCWGCWAPENSSRGQPPDSIHRVRPARHGLPIRDDTCESDHPHSLLRAWLALRTAAKSGAGLGAHREQEASVLSPGPRASAWHLPSKSPRRGRSAARGDLVEPRLVPDQQAAVRAAFTTPNVCESPPRTPGAAGPARRRSRLGTWRESPWPPPDRRLPAPRAASCGCRLAR